MPPGPYRSTVVDRLVSTAASVPRSQPPTTCSTHSAAAPVPVSSPATATTTPRGCVASQYDQAQKPATGADPRTQSPRADVAQKSECRKRVETGEVLQRRH